MLLPFECLAYTIVDGRLLPTWLGEADEPFVAAVLDSVAALAGLSVGEAELVAPGALARVAREAKMPVRVAEALWAIERRRWEARIDAAVDPEALREVVFELAARHPREAAISEAARRFGIAGDLVVGSLFADRKVRRVLVAPDRPPHPRDLVARYNLALAQALVARSMEVEATIAGDASTVARAAKRDGLLVRFDAEGETMRLTLTGPLAIFHDTAKYGRMIARFVPALMAAPSWSLRARVTLGDRSAVLALERDGAIAFASTVPAAPDGRLARRVARALRSAGVRVDLHPEPVRAGSTLVLPDFALEWSAQRVLVDVVPFATPEYLECKLAAAAALGVPMLVCVDARFISVESPAVVPYRGAIDAFSLYAAALRAASGGLRPSPSPSSGLSPSPSSELSSSPSSELSPSPSSGLSSSPSSGLSSSPSSGLSSSPSSGLSSSPSSELSSSRSSGLPPSSDAPSPPPFQA